MPPTTGSMTSGRLVVGLILLLAMAFGAYLLAGMPGMDHSSDGSVEEMDDMDHPRQMDTARR
jgi:hypothetical protein